MSTTAFERAKSMKLPAMLGLHNPDWVAKVLGFHALNKLPIKPFGNSDPEFGHMDDARVALRAGFQVEELLEMFAKGLGINARVIIEMPNGDELDASDDANIIKALSQSRTRSGKEIVDAASDSTYFWIGWLIEMGYDLRVAMDEVHGSNLTKPDENGEAILNGITPGYQQGQPGYRADQGTGKVLKGPNYMEPNLSAALGLED